MRCLSFYFQYYVHNIWLCTYTFIYFVIIQSGEVETFKKKYKSRWSATLAIFDLIENISFYQLLIHQSDCYVIILWIRRKQYIRHLKHWIRQCGCFTTWNHMYVVVRVLNHQLSVLSVISLNSLFEWLKMFLFVV